HCECNVPLGSACRVGRVLLAPGTKRFLGGAVGDHEQNAFRVARGRYCVQEGGPLQTGMPSQPVATTACRLAFGGRLIYNSLCTIQQFTTAIQRGREMGALYDFLQKNQIQKGNTLPAMHSTEAYFIKKFMSTGRIETHTCKYFDGEKLSYFFVG